MTPKSRNSSFQTPGSTIQGPYNIRIRVTKSISPNKPHFITSTDLRTHLNNAMMQVSYQIDCITITITFYIPFHS